MFCWVKRFHSKIAPNSSYSSIPLPPPPQPSFLLSSLSFLFHNRTGRGLGNGEQVICTHLLFLKSRNNATHRIKISKHQLFTNRFPLLRQPRPQVSLLRRGKFYFFRTGWQMGRGDLRAPPFFFFYLSSFFALAPSLCCLSNSLINRPLFFCIKIVLARFWTM